MEKNKTILSVEKLINEVATRLNYEVWDIRFLKEGSSWFLRIFIDSPSGITIDDCEKMSRALDKPLDDLDPISIPYCLEVCSPGLERELVKDCHFEKFMGQNIIIRLFRPLENGEKELRGKLKTFVNNIISLETESGEIFEIPKKDTAFVKVDDFN